MSQSDSAKLPAWRVRLISLVESNWFQSAVIWVICINALALGAETFDLNAGQQLWLDWLDLIFISLFMIELVLRLAAYGWRYFLSGWNILDFIVIMGSVLATSNLFAAFRAFRILRILRLITAVPRMRTVVKALFDSVPGILSVAVIVMLILYIFAVIAATLFGEQHPEMFGNIFASMYTLFQIITLEGWRDIADAVQTTHSYAWFFFISFVLVGTFTMLNLFIAIIVRVVDEGADLDEDAPVSRETAMLLDRIDGLAAEVAELKKK